MAQGGVLLASSGTYIRLKPGMMVSSAMVEAGGLHRGGFEHFDGQNVPLARSSSGGSLLSLQTVGTTTTTINAAGGHKRADSDSGSLMLPVDDFALSLDYYSTGSVPPSPVGGVRSAGGAQVAEDESDAARVGAPVFPFRELSATAEVGVVCNMEHLTYRPLKKALSSQVSNPPHPATALSLSHLGPRRKRERRRRCHPPARVSPPPPVR
jgi:hypothetical protein